jgi:hypothetical protein
VEYFYRRGFLDEPQYLEYVSTCVTSENEESTACVNYQNILWKGLVNSKANIYNIYGRCFPFIQDNVACVDAVGMSKMFNREENRKGLHVQSN